MIETMFTPAVASQIAQIMTVIMGLLMLLLAYQGVRDRVNGK